jgi:hypothetical protein
MTCANARNDAGCFAEQAQMYSAFQSCMQSNYSSAIFPPYSGFYTPGYQQNIYYLYVYFGAAIYKLLDLVSTALRTKQKHS